MGDQGPSGEFPFLAVGQGALGLLLMQSLPQKVSYGRRLKEHVSQPAPQTSPLPRAWPGHGAEQAPV